MRDFATVFAEFSRMRGALLVVALVLASPVFAEVTIRDADGKEHQPLAGASDAKPVVLIFVLHDCPICNAFAPEIERIHKEYAAKGVRLSVVYADATLTADEVKQHTKEYSLSCATLLDASQTLAGAVGAKKTPEAIIVGSENAVRYRGRINDLYADYGKKRAAPTKNDLREALDALLAGKPVLQTRTEAIGCNLPEKRSDQE